MLPALLAKIGLPLLTQAVGAGLAKIDNPVAAQAAGMLQEVKNAITAGAIPPTAVAEANRHVETLAGLDAADLQTALKEINTSLRTETGSEDAYVRRMRPTFGYIMALTWGAQMGAIAWTLLTAPEQAAAIVESMAALGTLWTVGLSVLGIYVFRRSDEKRTLLPRA